MSGMLRIAVPALRKINVFYPPNDWVVAPRALSQNSVVGGAKLSEAYFVPLRATLWIGPRVHRAASLDATVSRRQGGLHVSNNLVINHSMSGKASVSHRQAGFLNRSAMDKFNLHAHDGHGSRKCLPSSLIVVSLWIQVKMPDSRGTSLF
jgi:hypothetical protein